MVDQNRANRMATLEGWRIMSFSLGGPLGNVLSRSFDLITTVVRDGTANEMSIGYALESLKRERELAMSRDGQILDPLRNLLYGFSESLETMLESIMDERKYMLQQSLLRPLQHQPLHPQQPPMQLLQLQLPQEQQQDWSAASSQTSVPKIQRRIKEERAEPEPSPDIIIFENPPSSSQSAQLATPPMSARPPPETAATPSVPPLKRRRISREEAAVGTQCCAKNELTDKTQDHSLTIVNEASAIRQTTVIQEPPSTSSPVESSSQLAMEDINGCHECDRTFETKQGLKRHAFTHKAIRCPACNNYVARQKLNQHLADYHDPSSERFMHRGCNRSALLCSVLCPACDKSMEMENLSRHFAVKHGSWE